MNFEYCDKKEVKEIFSKNFKNLIMDEKINNNIFEIVFLCIGTDHITGDCFGPLVGTRLQEKIKNENIFNINIYGTLSENVCYTNVKDVVNQIKEKHKNACIVVIDAALSDESNMGKIFVQKGKMQLGKGLYKAKLEVGNISIKAVVGKNYKLSKYNFASLQNVSLNTVILLSDVVSEGIIEVIRNI